MMAPRGISSSKLPSSGRPDDHDHADDDAMEVARVEVCVQQHADWNYTLFGVERQIETIY